MNKRLVPLLLSAVAALAVVMFARQGEERFDTVNVDRFAMTIDSAGVQIVDVRTHAEYAEGHIPGAVLLDVKSNGFAREAERKLDVARTVAVYCRSGKRSADAARILSELGYRVINLSGGITEWKDDGRPTER